MIQQNGRIATAHGRFSRIYQVASLWTPTKHMLPWTHLSPYPKGHLDQCSRFAQLVSPCTLQCAAPFAPQNCPFGWGWTPSHAWFLGPTRVHIPKDISVSSIVLHSSWQIVPVLYNGPVTPLLPLKIAPLDDAGPHLMHSSLGPTESTAQTTSHLFQWFLNGSRS